jgi:hypothetical protein
MKRSRVKISMKPMWKCLQTFFSLNSYRAGWEPDMEQGDAYHYKYFGGVVTRVEGSNKVLVMNSPSTGALHLIIKTAQLSKHDYSPAMRTGPVRRSRVKLSVK